MSTRYKLGLLLLFLQTCVPFSINLVSLLIIIRVINGLPWNCVQSLLDISSKSVPTTSWNYCYIFFQYHR